MLVHHRPGFHWDECFWSRGPVSERAVRPLGVVVLSPAFDDDLGFSQRIEDFSVQQLISEPGVEALDVSVLPGASRFDEGGLRADSLDPGPNVLGNELGPIVASDKRRWSSQDEQVSEHIDDVSRF